MRGMRPAAVLAGIMLLLSPVVALADGGRGAGPEADAGGGTDVEEHEIDAFAHITFDTPLPQEGSGNGSLRPVDSPWVPPPCFYVPRLTPSEFKAEWQDYLNQGHHSGKGDAVRMHEERYGEDSKYKDHNIDKEGEGMWWRGEPNPLSSADHEEKLACREPTFWVDFDDSPPPETMGVFDPEVLAELAYQRISIPPVDLELNPDGAQYVNLATWVWGDGGADFGPVSVSASLNDWDVWATTTARPVSLTIDPGTDDAEVHPEDGECAIDEDGSFGVPYTSEHEDEAPPCGVTYRRATHQVDGYALTVSIRWEVAWEGSGGAGAELPASVVESEHLIEVEEAQAIVR